MCIINEYYCSNIPPPPNSHFLSFFSLLITSFMNGAMLPLDETLAVDQQIPAN